MVHVCSRVNLSPPPFLSWATCRQLKTSWDSRVEAIASLEGEMDRVRCSFEEREKALEGEKSAAEEHVRCVGETSRQCRSEGVLWCGVVSAV